MKRRFSLLVPLSLTAAILASSVSVAFAAAKTPNTPAKPVKLVIFNNSGAATNSGETSNTNALKMVHDYILEQTNFDIEAIIPIAGTAEEKLNTMLASNQELDLFWGKWTTYADAIQPVTEALEEYGSNIMKIWPEQAFSGITNKDGEIMGTPRGIPTAPYPIHLRSDWLDAVDMEYPSTLDELEAVLLAFKEQDPAGNGRTVPLGCDQNGLRNGLSAGFTGHGYGYYIDDDEKVKPVQLHPGYEDFVAKMASWYSQGLIYNEAFTTNRARYNELVAMGNFGGFAYWYSLISINSPPLTQSNPDAVYEYARPIMGPAGKIETHGAASDQGGLIPKYSKKLNEVIQYIDWSNSTPENYVTTLYGLKDEHWKYVDEKNTVIELIGNRAYIADFVSSLGTPVETLFSFDDPTQMLHNKWLKTHLFEFDGVVGADDWAVIYDINKIKEDVPEFTDIERMMNEQEILFITGVRPMKEWSKFIAELNKIGMDKLVDARTEQYYASIED